ncbi:MAG: phosphoribosylanthranilate isomerase [Deltaproteobacteria bacterium]|nr:phosphoribosylanthranilate isomerase [Deltaproteobacteria bacterium]
MSVRVKICGVTSVDDALLAVDHGADLIGLNFYPPSPRYVSLATAHAIRAVLPEHVHCVGVFVNAERAHIADLCSQLRLHAVQFHGDETTTDVQHWSCITIKALRVPVDGPLPDWQQFPVNYLLLDTLKPGRYGGTGERFSWERLTTLPVDCRNRLILAGGLTPENVTEAVQAVRPWAVDVASGVESAPGRKDPEKVRAFITNAKTT